MSFQDILDAPAGEAERPPAYPIGNYQVVIKGPPKRDKSSKKQTPLIEYTIVIQAILEADPGAVKEFEESQGQIVGKEWKDTWYLTENSAYRHKEFLLDVLGMDDKGESHWVMAQNTPGLSYIISVKHEASQDGKGINARIADRAKAE